MRMNSRCVIIWSRWQFSCHRDYFFQLLLSLSIQIAFCAATFFFGVVLFACPASRISGSRRRAWAARRPGQGRPRSGHSPRAPPGAAAVPLLWEAASSSLSLAQLSRHLSHLTLLRNDFSVLFLSFVFSDNDFLICFQYFSFISLLFPLISEVKVMNLRNLCCNVPKQAANTCKFQKVNFKNQLWIKNSP